MRGEPRVDLTWLAWKNLEEASWVPSTMLFAAEILRWVVVAGAEAMLGFGKEGVLMFKRGVLIPIPTWCLSCGWEAESGGEGFGPEW